MKILLRKVFNRLLLRFGFVLVNRHGYCVYLKNGKQVWNNPRRKRPYSLDDIWVVQTIK